MADGAVARDRLRSFIERIERLEEEKAALMADIREVYAEAKSAGFDPKVMRKVVGLRKMDENDRQEEVHLLDTYLAALGMLDAPPNKGFRHVRGAVLAGCRPPRQNFSTHGRNSTSQVHAVRCCRWTWR